MNFKLYYIVLCIFKKNNISVIFYVSYIHLSKYLNKNLYTIHKNVIVFHIKYILYEVFITFAFLKTIKNKFREKSEKFKHIRNNTYI